MRDFLKFLTLKSEIFDNTSAVTAKFGILGAKICKLTSFLGFQILFYACIMLGFFFSLADNRYMWSRRISRVHQKLFMLAWPLSAQITIIQGLIKFGNL